MPRRYLGKEYPPGSAHAEFRPHFSAGFLTPPAYRAIVFLSVKRKAAREADFLWPGTRWSSLNPPRNFARAGRILKGMGLLILGLATVAVVWLSVRQAKLNEAMRQMGEGPAGSGPHLGPPYAGPPE